MKLKKLGIIKLNLDDLFRQDWDKSDKTFSIFQKNWDQNKLILAKFGQD